MLERERRTDGWMERDRDRQTDRQTGEREMIKKMTLTKSGLKSFLVEAEFCDDFLSDQECDVVRICFFSIYYFSKGRKIKFALYRNASFENRLYRYTYTVFSKLSILLNEVLANTLCKINFASKNTILYRIAATWLLHMRASAG